MKTSEFIREAVDKYLAHGDDIATLAYVEVTDRQKYLCWCMDAMLLGRRYLPEAELIALREAKIKALQLIQDIMSDAATLESLYTAGTFFGVGQDLGYWTTIAESEYKLQEIRFMLAEFMALYFEDQGD